jgi:hypothetical protein
MDAERDEVEAERDGVAAAAAPELKHVTALTKARGGGEDGSAAATESATESATDAPLATSDPSDATLASSEMRESAAHTAGEPETHRGGGAGGGGGRGVGAGGGGGRKKSLVKAQLAEVAEAGGAGGGGDGGVGAGGEGAGSKRIRADRFNHQKIRFLFMLQMLHISNAIGDLF